MIGNSLRLVAFALLLASPAVRAASPERPASLDASLGQYAVVAPIFMGGSNTSFLRLVNAGETGSSISYSVSIVGSPSGNIYGTAPISVPAYASPQYSISEIMSAANVTGLANGDTAISLYIQSSDPGAGFMHVVYNTGNGFFENASVCQAYVQANADNKYLFNVHTSALAGYPTQIYMHNYSNVSATYRVTVREARSGTSAGHTDVTIPANATVSMAFAEFEQLIGWSPTASQGHANMEFEAIGKTTAPLTVAAFIFNTNPAFNTAVNMSAICQANNIFGGTPSGVKYLLTVSKTGTGASIGSVYSSPGGLSCGQDCSYSFDEGATVTLTAQPNNIFTGWSGACTGTAISCNVLMTEIKNVTATFTSSSSSGGGTSGGGSAGGGASNFTLTVTKQGGGGSVTSSSGEIDCGSICSGSFASNRQITLTALGTGGKTFLGWSGACTSIGVCNLNMTQDRSVTATFSN